MFCPLHARPSPSPQPASQARPPLAPSDQEDGQHSGWKWQASLQINSRHSSSGIFSTPSNSNPNSNCSEQLGSSSSSWYFSKKGWAKASSAVMRRLLRGTTAVSSSASGRDGRAGRKTKLRGAVADARAERQALVQQIQSGLRRFRVECRPGHRRHLPQPRDVGLRPLPGDVTHVRLGGRPNHADDLRDLVHVILAGEDGLPAQHLGEDAPRGPDVDGLGVRTGEDELRRAVPSGHDVLRHLLLRLHLPRAHCAKPFAQKLSIISFACRKGGKGWWAYRSAPGRSRRASGRSRGSRADCPA